MVPAILTFTVGAAGGALGYIFAGFWCIAAPIAILLVIFGREIGR